MLTCNDTSYALLRCTRGLVCGVLPTLIVLVGAAAPSAAAEAPSRLGVSAVVVYRCQVNSGTDRLTSTGAETAAPVEFAPGCPELSSIRVSVAASAVRIDF
jgi:hypothetical protein